MRWLLLERLRKNIQQHTPPNTRSICSLDAEWPTVAHSDDHSVALIQVGNEHFALLVRTRIGVNKVSELPSSLLSLINDTNIDKVGPNIGGDKTRINNAWPGSITATNFINLMTIARQKLPHLKKYKLQDLSMNVLGRSVDKSMQISNWSRADSLSTDQEMYAAADFALPCMIYQKISVTGAIFAPVQSLPTPVSVSTTKKPPPPPVRWEDVSLTSVNPDTDVDPWSNQTTEELEQCIIAASKSLMYAFSKVCTPLL